MTSKVGEKPPNLNFDDLRDKCQSPPPAEQAICFLCKKIFNDHGIRSKFCSKECSLNGIKVVISKPKHVKFSDLHKRDGVHNNKAQEPKKK